MERWVLNGTTYQVTRVTSTPPPGMITYKVRRPRWREEQHPRDRRGRFVETGDPVTLLGGVVGTYQGTAPGGRVRVRVPGETEDRVVLRRHVEFTGRAPAKPASQNTPTPSQPSAPEPAPPNGQVPSAKPTRIARSHHDAVNALKIDASDSGYSAQARQAAALLRAKKPMTAADTDALSVAVRQAAAQPGVSNAAALERAAQRIDALTAQLRGFKPGALPGSGISSLDLDTLQAGQIIAIPHADGGVDVREVNEASKVSDGYKLTVATPSGATEQRYIYPGTDVRLFDATTMADAVKLLDTAEGTPGKPKGLYDDDDPDLDADVEKLIAAIGGPKTAGGKKTKNAGEVGPNTMWFDHLALSGDDSQPIPVSDLTIEGYTVANGIAWRRGGRSYLVELKPGESTAEAKARGDRTATLLEQVLEQVPAEKAAAQRGLALLQGDNPADSYWAKTYNMPGFHSGATGGHGGTTVWRGVEPKPTTLAHEFGHTIDSTSFGTNQWLSQASYPVVSGQEKSWTFAAQDDELTSSFYESRFTETRLHPFVKPITVGQKGVTQYGGVDVREDFAESVRLWMKDRREGKVGYDPTTGDNIRYSDLFPARARVLDAVFGTTTDFDTAARKRRRQEAEDAYVEHLKAHDGGGTPPPPVSALMAVHGLSMDDMGEVQAAAHKRFAKSKHEAAAKAKAEAEAQAVAEKLAADKLKAQTDATEKVASISDALAGGHLAAADAKKFRAAVTRYKAKLRAQGLSEAEIAQLAAAYETALIHKQFGLGDFSTPKASAMFSSKENTAANKLLQEAGKVQHPLASKQYSAAPQAKSNIAAELATRLDNPQDWELFRTVRAAGEFSDHGDFDSVEPEVRHDILSREVSERVATWASSSGDGNPNAVLMQEAVKQEFGLSAPTAPRIPQEKYDDIMGKMWSSHGPWYQRVARVMYEHTQEEFAKAGITRISVYRGMRFSPFKGIPSWAQEDGVRPVGLQPLNSWSSRRATARKFVDKYGNGSHKVMLKASFPVELVLGSALTGFGCLDEQEFVIFDADGDINVELL